MNKFSKYSDLNENPTSDRDVIITDYQAIFQSLDNILEIVRGERLFNNKGLNPDAELFELGTDDDALDLFTSITQEISAEEPRVILDMGRSSIIPDYDNNRYAIELYITVREISNESVRYMRSL